jgi:outer membrane receptor for ferrienterochelin and colicin
LPCHRRTYFATENGVFAAATDNTTALAKLDHRVNAAHAFMLRYGFDRQQSLRDQANITSDTSQVDILNRSHSVVFEETWSPAQNIANAFRVHLLNHSLGTTPRSTDVGIRRPSGSMGQTNNDAQILPQTRLTIVDALYRHTPRHELKVGGELSFATQDNDSHVFEYGLFEFQTDASFDINTRSTWPNAFSQQKPSVVTYRSREMGVFVQDDWRMWPRLVVNAGLRYDIDFTLRINDFYDACSTIRRGPGWIGSSVGIAERIPITFSPPGRDVGCPRRRPPRRPWRLGHVCDAKPSVVSASLDEPVHE